ncbi:MAG: copper amine oxidase N-terminal domain-containing protein [Mycobacterium leprae]
MKTWQRIISTTALIAITATTPALAAPGTAPSPGVTKPPAPTGDTTPRLPGDGMPTDVIHPIYVRALFPVKADRMKVATVTVGGQAVQFDQGPVVIDGSLMVPLRAVAEAAGGKVTWEQSEHKVIVQIGNDFTFFVIGQEQGELRRVGVFYIRPNTFPMAHAPVLIGNRTLISADALSTILGFKETAPESSEMDLILDRN